MEELNVLYACDDTYAPYCGTSITSLLINNQDIERIRLFVVADNVSSENKSRLERTAKLYSRELQLLSADDVRNLMEQIGVPKYRGSYATHYRKYFQLFVPDDVGHLLYLDSDTIVHGSLKKLMNFDMHGRCVGAVLDALGGRYKRLLGFRESEPYFNAGVMWIDTEAWRRQNYSEKILSHVKNVRSQYCNPDQDLFNIVLKGDVAVLPILYNFQPVHRAYSDRSYFLNYPHDYYSVEEIEEARQSSVILHTYRFLGEFPWHKGNMHPDNDVFDKYLRLSEWNDYEKKRASVGPLFRVEKLMYRCMSPALFLALFQRALYLSFYNRNRIYEKRT